MLKDLRSWKNSEILATIELNQVWQALALIFFLRPLVCCTSNHSDGASMGKNLKPFMKSFVLTLIGMQKTSSNMNQTYISLVHHHTSPQDKFHTYFNTQLTYVKEHIPDQMTMQTSADVIFEISGFPYPQATQNIHLKLRSFSWIWLQKLHEKWLVSPTIHLKTSLFRGSILVVTNQLSWTQIDLWESLALMPTKSPKLEAAEGQAGDDTTNCILFHNISGSAFAKVKIYGIY